MEERCSIAKPFEASQRPTSGTVRPRTRRPWPFAPNPVTIPAATRAAAGETGPDFIRRMTTKTDGTGGVGTEFGPYFLRMPTNPFNDLDTVRVGNAAAGANTHGWRFDPATGEFQADDNIDADHNGIPDHVGL